MKEYVITDLDEHRQSKNTIAVYASAHAWYIVGDWWSEIEGSRYLHWRAFPRLGFLDSCPIYHLDPRFLYTPCDQAFCNSLDVFALHHDLLQLRLA